MELIVCCCPALMRRSRAKDYEAPAGQAEGADNTQDMKYDNNKKATHVKARTGKYPGSEVARYEVPDDKVHWSIEYSDYKPVEYTIEKIKDDKPVWADPAHEVDSYDEIKFNDIDGITDRTSFMGKYEFIQAENGKSRPRNPVGRTGISGRGLLGKWGPNHAADPIVTRWKRDEKGNQLKVGSEKANEKPILEFVAIQRRDNLQWAIPGGMVDNGEHVSLTLKREFGEEAMNSIEETERDSTKKLIDALFEGGDVIYKGYVDDPRNTDNSWMETVAMNFHDDDGTNVGKVPLQAGDDAKNVTWLAIDRELKLYASHFDFIKETCMRRGAFFPTIESK